MTPDKIKNIIEAVLLSAEHPMSVQQVEALFQGDVDCPTRDEIRKGFHELGEDYANRGFELKQVASGFRLQVKQDFAPWVGRMWEEKPARYSRALLETIALIAYRQPITRGEIEEVRGVSVSTNIIKTLLERDWVKVLGHKDVPGKPSLYGTTREFLDYFNLKSLDELPTLAEIKDLDQIHPELALNEDMSEDNAAQSDTAEAADVSSDEQAEEQASADTAGQETEAESSGDVAGDDISDDAAADSSGAETLEAAHDIDDADAETAGAEAEDSDEDVVESSATG